MTFKSKLNICMCIAFLPHPKQSHAEGGIYFRCLIGENEYLLSENDEGGISYVNLKVVM